MNRFACQFFSLLLVAAVSGIAPAAENDSLKILFLGDDGPHQPAKRADILMPVLAQRGIDIHYTEDVERTLQLPRLKQFDGLLVYANIDRIGDDQAAALVDYVEQGGGFIPLHSASFCFRNQPEAVALIGAQFQRHGTGEFTVQPTEAARTHPVMQGYRSFESWDETYVHTLHNDAGRTVLETRREGDSQEPWTWVRTQGEGRVFYTAWGHDHRTWSNPGFQNLVERGIRWACGGDPSVVPDFAGAAPEAFADVEMTPPPSGPEPFEYVEVGPKIPNYAKGAEWGTQDDPIAKMQKPLSPRESMKRYRTPVGFDLELYAAEPDIGGKPICMNWDARGRLWIAETVDYPNEKQPEGQGRDRIRILEDTDGDGSADKFTVFADNLSIPTSLAFSHGGVIVHQAPDTLFLKDTDGDDRADVREVLFTGWNTHDTHAGPSNLAYGHDNWFYGIVGYAGFEGEIAGEQRSFRTGFYRFRVEEIDGEVEVTDFEFLRNTDNNSWGIGFSEEGILFGSTANRNPSEYMPIANRYYEQVRGWTSSVLEGIADTYLFDPVTDKVRQVDHHGGYTAAAGHALYTARQYPQPYWNRTALVCGPTGHLVGTFVLKPNGAGFESENAFNLMASDDEWAAPTMAEIGPDGNVWVIDWYNYIVQHNPTPIGFETGKGNAYVTELRDKKHGRIYRVRHQREPASADRPVDSLVNASAAELVDALSHSNMFWRRHAQRLLVERGETDVTDALLNLVARRQLDPIGLDVGAIHALRTLDGLDRIGQSDGEVTRAVHQALEHPSAGVVRTAVEVLPRDAASRQVLLDAGTLQHEDGQVRLVSLLALSEMPPSETAASAVLQAFAAEENQGDRWLTDAATSAAATHGGPFLVQLAKRPEPSDTVLEAAEIVAEHLARQENGEVLQAVIQPLVDSTPAVADAVITGFLKGWPRDATLQIDPATEEALVKVFERVSPESKGQLIELASKWGSERLTKNAEEITDALMEIVEDEDAEPQQRIDAAAQLASLRSESSDAADELLSVISARTPQDISTGILRALRNSRSEDLGEIILSHLDRFTPAVRSAAIRTMLARPETTRSLLEALQNNVIARADLALDQQQGLLSHPKRELRQIARKALSSAGGVPSSDRAKILKELMPLTEQAGDVARGKEIFKKHCGTCHTHRGEGTAVGPDLTGMAVHPKEELLTHIIDPSQSVEGNYRSYSVLTLDGIVITGMLASETQNAIELYDAQGKRHVVLREDIDQLIASEKSVMPEGFEKQIDDPGFVDLLEFLTSKGRYLPLPMAKSATAVSTKGLFHTGDNGPDRLVFDDWTTKISDGVPFQLVDPRDGRVPNIVLLHGPRGTLPPQMPEAVRVPCNSAAQAIHFLSGVSGWGYPAHDAETVSMTVRLHYADGHQEDHPLKNGIHFADYIRRVDVPQSEFAFELAGGQQVRQLTIEPGSDQPIDEIELIKGDDPTAPIVVAITVETGASDSSH